LVDKSKFIVGYKSLNNLSNIVRAHKDKTDFNIKNNVVYKIRCKNCGASYVGQTKRQLQTKIKKHFNNTRMDPSRHNNLGIKTYGNLFMNLNIIFGDTEILDLESKYNKRLISEMMHIKE